MQQEVKDDLSLDSDADDLFDSDDDLFVSFNRVSS